MRAIGSSLHLTTAYHPEADGRSERTNKTVFLVIRTFTTKGQRRWLEALPSAEFSVNSAVNVASGNSLFEIVFGRKPRLFPTLEVCDDVPSSVGDWIKRREELWQTARDELWASRVRQAIQHNRSRRQPHAFSEGDWVLLGSQIEGRWQAESSMGGPVPCIPSLQRRTEP